MLIPVLPNAVPSSQFAPCRIGTCTNLPSPMSFGPTSIRKSPSTDGAYIAEVAAVLLKMADNVSIGTWRRHSRVSLAELQFAASVMLL